MIRSKIDWHFIVALLVLATCQLSWSGSAEAQSPKPPTKETDDKPVIYGCHEVELDYHLRFPHAKEYVNQCWDGLEKNDLIPITPVKIEMKSVKQLAVDIKPGPTLHKKAKAPTKGDKYCGFNPATERPQYWGLEVPCGAPTGWVYPPLIPSAPEDTPTQTGPGPFVKQHAKNCKGGEGGAITCLPPSPFFIPKCYKQNALYNKNKNNISKEGDQSIWEYELTTFGVGPISDTQYQIIERENNQRFIEMFFDPERWYWMSKAAPACQQQQMSENMGQTADNAFNESVNEIQKYLINVANENAATPTSAQAGKKTQSEVIWMVQQMYKQVYIPMAILLLLPGAVMTQMKSMVQFGMLKMQDDTTDTNSPFMGIIRSIIAVFLIPATQLIVSYMIDMGNSLQYECKKYVKADEIKKYGQQQQPDPKIDTSTNAVVPSNIPSLNDEGRKKMTEAQPPSPGQGAQSDEEKMKGKAASAKESQHSSEKTSKLSQLTTNMFNFMNTALNHGLHVLCGFQLVMMCYLFLLGPVAACFYAWPNVNKGSGGPGLFNKVFANWLDAVVILSLWRFWWMVVLVTMTTYFEWARELGFFDPAADWEKLVFTSFEVLLAYVPFQPFNFDAKGMVGAIEQKAAQQSNPTGNNTPPGANPGGGNPGQGGPQQATSSNPGGQGGTTPSGGTGGRSAPAMTPAAAAAPAPGGSPTAPGGTGGGAPPSSTGGGGRTPAPMPNGQPGGGTRGKPGAYMMDLAAKNNPPPAGPAPAPPPPSGKDKK